jgi:hypothetical protein
MGQDVWFYSHAYPLGYGTGVDAIARETKDVVHSAAKESDRDPESFSVYG